MNKNEAKELLSIIQSNIKKLEEEDKSDELIDEVYNKATKKESNNEIDER